MEEKRYLISDAAKLAGVEAHVLRYWEEELDLSIGRTELGHRYYTRENIETFQRIKELKAKGLQLKAIREILKENAQEASADSQKDGSGAGECFGEDNGRKETQEDGADSRTLLALQENTEKLRRFEELVGGIVDRVVRENSEELERRIEAAFSRNVDELVRLQEMHEEERFRRLDEAIRQRQMAGREAAAARENGFLRRWLEKWRGRMRAQ